MLVIIAAGCHPSCSKAEFKVLVVDRIQATTSARLSRAAGYMMRLDFYVWIAMAFLFKGQPPMVFFFPF